MHEATITLRINASGSSEEECVEKIQRARHEIRERLGELVFGEGDDSLASVVVSGLVQRNRSLATAEIGTGGVLMSWLSDVGGAEKCLAGGHVLTDADGMGRAFGGDGRIEREGNSESTARDLATLCRDHYGSDYALSVADCPDYDPDDPDAEAPTTWVACAGPDGVKTKSLTLLGDVSFTRSRSAKTALDLLRGMLPAEN